MSQDYKNAMEELARASLCIRDLADGIVGTVLIEADAFAGAPSGEDVESHRLALEEIYEGQADLALRGWTRAPEFLTKRMWMPNHNVERAAWFKDDHEKKETKWITCSITTRFGLRATFTNEPDPGTRLVQGDELRAIAEEYYGYEMEEE
jgi:hypothetical protein